MYRLKKGINKGCRIIALGYAVGDMGMNRGLSMTLIKRRFRLYLLKEGTIISPVPERPIQQCLTRKSYTFI